MSRPARRVIIAPANREPQIAGLENTPNGVKLGTPLREPTGVTNRRIAYSHGYADADVAWILARVADAFITEELPADWRWQT